MKRLLRPLIALLLLAATLVPALAALRPDHFSIERTVTISAPPARIFPMVDDFTRWYLWSPWELRDPRIKRTFGNPNNGAGATYAWSGNHQIGQGRVKITSTRPTTWIYIDLEMIKPLATRNNMVFHFEPAAADSTRLTWTMKGPRPFFVRVVGLFVDLDQRIGADFAQGLDNLKRAVETDSNAPASAPASK